MDFRVFSRNISENMHARCVREDTKQALKGNLQADGVQSRQTLFVRYCLKAAFSRNENATNNFAEHFRQKIVQKRQNALCKRENSSAKGVVRCCCILFVMADHMAAVFAFFHLKLCLEPFCQFRHMGNNADRPLVV